MSFLKYLLSVAFIVSLMSSCKKEMSIEDGKPVEEETDWQFSVTDNKYKGNVDTAFITEGTGFNILTLQGTTVDGVKGQIIMQLLGEQLTPGIYTDPYAYFIYMQDGQKTYESIIDNKEFSITITSIDSFTIAGSFAGVVENREGSQVTITEGKFEGVISWEKLETITPNPANDDYFQMGSEWEYANESDNNDRVIIRVVGDTLINVNGTQYKYSIFQNNRTGQHRYFRKDGPSNFHEYTFTQLGNTSTPTELDMMILNQEANEWEEWESDEYVINSGGMAGIPAKIRNTITEKLESFKVGGYLYEDVMFVDTELYVSIGGNFQYGDQAYSTVYAKGLGMIIYFDYNLQAFYLLKRYQP